MEILNNGLETEPSLTEKMMKSKLIGLLLLTTFAPVVAQTQQASYEIAGNDTSCQVFLYSPGPNSGLHVAYLDDQQTWKDLGQLCGSDYGPWGAEKKMYDPYVLKAEDGTWRLLFGVNDNAPCFGVAYSEDLVTWRPQDYPRMTVRGCRKPIAFTNDTGGFDIYFQSAKDGHRFLSASKDFRTFSTDEPSTIEDVAWLRDTATVGDKQYEGNVYDIPKVHLDYIARYQQALAEDARQSSEKMIDDGRRFATLNGVNATLHVTPGSQKPISDKLYGVFFEDINYAADGGLYAELVQNRDFEYSSRDHGGWNATTAWTVLNPETGLPVDGKIEIVQDQPLSKYNPHYIVLRDQAVGNRGWDGMCVNADSLYDLSLQARLMSADGKKKKMKVALLSADGKVLAEEKLQIASTAWTEYKVQLKPERQKGDTLELYSNAILALLPQGEAPVAVDMVSLMPQNTFKGHGLRRDLAEAIAAIHPKFVRFPGGCMSHGNGIGNIYHWKHSVGKLENRIPDFNIWHYHQTRGLGFAEYFQFCQDIGAEPLPVLAAGVPCQNSSADSTGYAGQQGGIDMKDMPAYCQEIVDLIGWARKNYHLNYIGIGNEDIISTPFEQRFKMIAEAVKRAYPDIKVVGTAGPFHYPSADYVEGWKFGKENKAIVDLLDEHYYESTGWFLHHQDYYDDYDRKGPKVYLGEYASKTRTLESALAEAVYLCHVERNADVVEMTSYAPLLCNDRHHNWDPDLIYFTNTSVTLTPSYETQRLFSTHSGDRYVASRLSADTQQADALRRLASSVVVDSKTGTVYVKLVNALPCAVNVTIDGLQVPEGSTVQTFSGQPSDKTVTVRTSVTGGKLQLEPYSVNVITVKK